jgi:hypothetical protein
MATATLARQSIPLSFSEAIKSGWSILSETSRCVRGSRCGTVVLEKGGRRISVSYFADRDGYRFGFVKVL